MTETDSVIIASGGLDSTALLYYMIRCKNMTPLVVSFDYGQKHKKELEYLSWHLGHLLIAPERLIHVKINHRFLSSSLVSTEMDVFDSSNQNPSTYVPNRNMIMLSVAIGIAEDNGIGEVYYGAQRQDTYHYWDTNNSFLEKINSLLSVNDRTEITVKAPFIEMSKTEVVATAIKLGVDVSKTWSCYSGKDEPCGKCHTCIEREIAFKSNGIGT